MKSSTVHVVQQHLCHKGVVEQHAPYCFSALSVEYRICYVYDRSHAVHLIQHNNYYKGLRVAIRSFCLAQVSIRMLNKVTIIFLILKCLGCSGYCAGKTG